MLEIKRIADANNGKAPGTQVFESETGIKKSAWLGAIWPKWGDALSEAGYAPNVLQKRTNEELIFKKLVQAFRHFGHSPSEAELRMYHRNIDPEFPLILHLLVGMAQKLICLENSKNG